MTEHGFAIVGIGCRFPGSANSPEALWDLLVRGVDAITDIPADRTELIRLYDADPAKPGHLYLSRGGFMDRIDGWDAAFFGISPREATHIDPQHRLLLEVTWEALEDAGIPADRLAGSRTGVFIGISTHDYGDIQIYPRHRDRIDSHSNSGTATSIAANRISYLYDFRGPSFAVDTACSSSLTALHLACRSLRDGECDLALVGGVQVHLNPELTIGFCKAAMISPDGECRAFDASANGYVRGEGTGVVVLKPLGAAIADGDRIYSIVAGTAINQDGHTTGMTVPSAAAQLAGLREALANAGVDPADVQYVEAHGTGTPVGDPIEASAIAAVFGGRPAHRPLAIGSIKTNIGHLEAASGVAGLIKASLAIRHRALPPSLHFTVPNPAIDLAASRLRVVTALEPWPHDGTPAMAAVNSFGFGGANAHAVLREAPGAGGGRREEGGVSAASSLVPAPPASRLPPPAILPLSARSPDALAALARSYMTFLGDATAPLGAIAASAAMRRAQHEHRATVVATTPAEAIDALDGFLAGEARTALATGRAAPRKLAFVFSGMGPQWWGMGQQLRAESRAFRETLERCHEALRPHAPWSLLDELARGEADSRIAEPDLAQVTNFAIQVAIASQLEEWGIVPDAVVGHSAGEMAAAYVAGALSLEDAIRASYHRSRLQQKAKRGRILAVGLSESDARSLIADCADDVAIAAVNAPMACTLAGETEALARIMEQLQRDQVFARYLTFEVPYHSPLMDPVRDELVSVLDDLDARPTRIPLISTVTASVIDGTAVGAHYWWRNVRETVRFADSLGVLADLGYTTFLEVSPHPVLGGSIVECLGARNEKGTVLATLRRKEDERATLLRAVAALWTLGRPVRWENIVEPESAFVSLPRYPWQHERHWFEPTPADAFAETDAAPGAGSAHPLLGRRLSAAHPTWESPLGGDRLAYVDDHLIQGAVIMPGAAYVEMALAAAAELLATPAVRDVEFRHVMFLPRRPEVVVQLASDAGGTRFDILSAGRADRSKWTLHAAGTLGTANGSAPAGDLEAIRARLVREIPHEACYATLWQHGFEYGPSFRGIEHLWVGQGESLGRIALASPVETDGYLAHPALVDAAFQCVIHAVESAGSDTTGSYLPVRVAEFILYAPIGDKFWSHARLVERGDRTFDSDLTLFDDAGTVLASVRGLRCQRLDDATVRREETIDDWLYEYQWERRALPGSEDTVGLGVDADQVASNVQPSADRLSRELKWDEYYTLVEPRLDEIATAYAERAFTQLGWTEAPGRHVTAAALFETLGIAPSRRSLGDRLLALLESAGVLDGGDGEWEVVREPRAGNPDALAAALVAEQPSYATDVALLSRCGNSLAAVLAGRADGRDVFFADGGAALVARFYREAPPSRYYNTLAAEALAAATVACPADRTLRVLEIGAGTGGTTAYALPRLPADRTEYVFTDVSPLFTGQAAERFSEYPFLFAQPLDIERDPIAQGFVPNGYDVVLAVNVLHGTASIAESLANVRRLLAPGGVLLLVEITRRLAWMDVIFGLTDGWWRFTDRDVRPAHPLLDVAGWRAALERAGFASVAAIADTTHDGEAGQTVLVCHPERESAFVIPSEREGPASDKGTLARSEGETARDNGVASLPHDDSSVLVLADASGTADALIAQLESTGVRCSVATVGDVETQTSDRRFQIPAEDPGAVERVLAALDAGGASPRAIVYLWGLDAPEPNELPADDILDTQSLTSRGVLGIVQAVATTIVADRRTPELWLVTAGAQAMNGGPTPLALAQAPVWGLARCVMRERPDLPCRLVDLGRAPNEAEVQALAREIVGGQWDEEIALRGRDRFVRRLKRVALPKAREERVAPGPGDGFRVEIGTPGALETFSLRPIARRPPGPDEVEISIAAAGLNFREVMLAMGMLPPLASEGTFGGKLLGFDCAGTVTSVGENVVGLTVGDEVMGSAPGSLASFATTPAAIVTRRPASLSTAQAAGIPAAFVTAYYSLVHLARLQRGERVLIHAATGGVGLAAIQIARDIGAEVFATAGSAAKRDHLASLGVEHVMDSRSLRFADEVMERTSRAGVDVVLNSLAGEAIPKGIATLAPFGRFVEIGKRDVYGDSRIGLLAFRKNISFFAVDLDRLALERPALCGEMLRAVAERFEDGRFQPLPVQTFPISEVESAIRHMAQAKHIGKIVLNVKDPAAEVARSPDDGPLCRADGTYLITGGLGGFGLAVAEWLTKEGARALALVGRGGGGGDASALERVDRLRAAGTRVEVIRADVSRGSDVRQALDQVRASMPPLRGVIHAAMVLDDAPLGELSRERFDRVLAPKMAGAWHLHEQTRDDALDIFVLFSSMAALFGNPTQSNYAASNAFLDALAHQRRAHGLPALSINWGVLAEIGYVSRHATVAEHLERQGYLPFSPLQALGTLGALLRRDVRHIMAARIDWGRWATASSTAAASPMLRHFVRDSVSAGEGVAAQAGGASATGTNSPLATIIAAPPAARRDRLDAYLREKVAKVLGIAPARLDAEHALTEMGFDSLIAVELMTVLKMDLGVELPAVKLLQGVSLSGLASLVIEQLGAAMTADVGSATTATPTADARAGVPDLPATLPPPTRDEMAALPVVAVVAKPPAHNGNGHIATTIVDATSNGSLLPASPIAGRVDYASLDYTRWSRKQRVVRGALTAAARTLTELHIEGREHLPRTGGYVLAVNHLSVLDTPVILSVLDRRTVIYASEHLRQSPFIHWVLGEVGNAIYVRRGDGDMEALEQGLTVLRSGGVLGLGPEGTRSRTGGLGPGKSGVAYLATRADVPVIPLAAWGHEDAVAQWRRFRRPAVTVRIGPALRFPQGDAGAAELHHHTERIMRAIAALLPESYRGVYV